MKYWCFIIPVVILLLLFTFFLLLHRKKKSVIQKVCSLSTFEKKELLNHLAEPLGYSYDPCQDIFVTRTDAPQKLFGYTQLYDLSAAYFNMVFDYETIYFNYRGRTWLLEIWKGQYGLSSGCELGIYYADSIVDPKDYSTTLFHAVDAKDMLDISLKLNRHCTGKACSHSRMGYHRSRHWWLTIFKPGTFSLPQNLFVNASVHFKDYAMLSAFLDSFEEALPDTLYKVNGLTVYFTFCKSNRAYSLCQRFVRCIALWFCRISCKWFNCITRPFHNCGNKILYLYYYLPFVVRHMFKPRKCKK